MLPPGCQKERFFYANNEKNGQNAWLFAEYSLLLHRFRKEMLFDMVLIVQLVRASDCGSECRGFESH